MFTDRLSVYAFIVRAWARTQSGHCCRDRHPLEKEVFFFFHAVVVLLRCPRKGRKRKIVKMVPTVMLVCPVPPVAYARKMCTLPPNIAHGSQLPELIICKKPRMCLLSINHVFTCCSLLSDVHNLLGLGEKKMRAPI